MILSNNQAVGATADTAGAQRMGEPNPVGAKVVGDFYSTVSGYDIRRWVTGYAYPRNGNTHTTTPCIVWAVYKNGRRQGNEYTLRGAKELIALLLSGGEG